MHKSPLNDFPPYMQSPVSVSPSPTPCESTKPSRHSPDLDPDGAGWNLSSLVPPKRSISRVSENLNSPSQVVATFREVLHETPIFSGQGSKSTTQDTKEQQAWLCNLCVSKNSIITSPEACAVCGCKRHDVDGKSRLSSLTKAGLELAKKWKHDDDSVIDAPHTKRRFPHRNSFSSATSIGSASTQKVSNTTSDPEYRQPKSTLGDLAMFLLTTASSSSSTSSRKLKTPRMPSDDEDLPTRPAKLYPAPCPTAFPSAVGAANVKPPRHPPRPTSTAHSSPSRPLRPQRRGQYPDAAVPDFVGRPIPDDATDVSVTIPKRPSSIDQTSTVGDDNATLSKGSKSSRVASLLMQLTIPFEHNGTNANESSTCEHDGLYNTSRAFSGEVRVRHRIPPDGDEGSHHGLGQSFDIGEDIWEEGLSPMSSSGEMPNKQLSSFDTEPTDDPADISLHIGTIENGQRCDDAVSISIFSDEQSSHIPTTVPKRRTRCYCFSYPLSFCVLMAILTGSLLAAFSSVINWDNVGYKIREAFGYSVPSSTNNSTVDPNTLPTLYNNVPTFAPLWPGVKYPIPTNASTFQSQWVKAGNALAATTSRVNVINQVILGGDGTFLAVGSTSTDQASEPNAIKVYSFDGVTWSQHGRNIDGEIASRDHKKIAFADGGGLTLAVASSGSIRVYASSANDTEWRQVGSPILVAGNGNGQPELSVSLSSDGLTVAAGILEEAVATQNNVFSAKYSGNVAIYAYQIANNDWIQVGADIVLSRLNEADANVSQGGIEIQLSGNGQLLAVRDWLTGNGHLASQSNVQVYRSVYQNANSSIWQEMGSVITTDQVDGSFSFSKDGSNLAVTDSFESRVLQFNEESKDWTPSPGTLPGGSSIALSGDSSVVAIATHGKDLLPGSVETYAYATAAMGNWSRLTPDLPDNSAGGWIGNSVSMSQDMVSVLAMGLRDSVQVYRLSGTS